MKKLILFSFIFVLALSACQPAAPAATPGPQQHYGPATIPKPTYTPAAPTQAANPEYADNMVCEIGMTRHGEGEASCIIAKGTNWQVVLWTNGPSNPTLELRLLDEDNKLLSVLDSNKLTLTHTGKTGSVSVSFGLIGELYGITTLSVSDDYTPK